MKAFIKELETNYATFSEIWNVDRQSAVTRLAQHDAKYKESYFRIVSLQAWRTDVLQTQISDGALSFFLEAQNDALVSHVLAQMGSWRQALQALRGTIENVLFCAYYMDHPVELALWNAGHHKVSFSELIDYFTRHPKIQGVPASLTGISAARSEYSTLSRAVHASAHSFRMTHDAHATQLWIPDVHKLGAWITREKSHNWSDQPAIAYVVPGSASRHCASRYTKSNQLVCTKVEAPRDPESPKSTSAWPLSESEIRANILKACDSSD